MKTALTVSALLNLALAGSLVFLFAQRKQPSERPLPPPTAAGGESAPVATTTAPVVAPVKAKPFSWHELEASDYRTYVRNLRNSGCPEATVRAIVTADVAVVYRLKTHELEQKLAALANGSWSVQLASYAEQQALKAALQKMPAEESSEVAYLLGLAPAPVAAISDASKASAITSAGTDSAPVVPAIRSASDYARASATTAAGAELTAMPLPATDGQNNLAANSVSYPLVFQNVDLTSLHLGPDQMQAVENLKQSFVNQIGGQNQNPNDPAYRQRWQEAQDTADNMLRDLLGWTGFQSYQIAARANPSTAVPVTP